MTTLTLIFILFVIFTAILGQVVLGFGVGLIAIPLLSVVLGIKDAVVVTLLVQTLSCLLMSPTIKHIDKRVAIPLLIGMIPTTLLGIYFLGVIPEYLLRWVLFLFLLLFLLHKIGAAFLNARKTKQTTTSLEMLAPTPSTQPHPAWAWFAGSIAGVLQGMLGTGGPPLVMFLSLCTLDKYQFRAILILLFLVVNITRFALSASIGLFNETIWYIGLYALPLFALALWLGRRLHHLMTEKIYRISVYSLLTLSLISIAVKL